MRRRAFTPVLRPGTVDALPLIGSSAALIEHLEHEERSGYCISKSHG